MWVPCCLFCVLDLWVDCGYRFPSRSGRCCLELKVGFASGSWDDGGRKSSPLAPFANRLNLLKCSLSVAGVSVLVGSATIVERARGWVDSSVLGSSLTCLSARLTASNHGSGILVRLTASGHYGSPYGSGESFCVRWFAVAWESPPT